MTRRLARRVRRDCRTPARSPIEPGDYAELFHAAIADRKVRRPEADVRVRIFGPLEARLQSVDRLVLGGLVEGVWPPETRSDPWLSRPMRHELGLDLPERRIGLSAHDFAQALGAPEVILTPRREAGRRADRRVAFRAAARRGRRRGALGRGARARRALRGAGAPARRDRRRRSPPRARRRSRRSRRGRGGSASPRSRTGCAIPTRSTPSTCSSCTPLDDIDTPPGARRPRHLHPRRHRRVRQGLSDKPCPPIRSRAMIELGERAFEPLADFPEATRVLVAALPAHRRNGSRASKPRAAPTSRRSRPRSAAASRFRSAPTTFTLTVRADRIECLADGRYAILDYKTGAPPTERQVRTGLSPQLTLEAAILRQGGFETSRPAARSQSCSMCGCAAAPRPAKKGRSSSRTARPTSTPTTRWRELTKRARASSPIRRSPITRCCIRCGRTHYGTYDHLARVQEWSLTGGADDDGGGE